MNDSKIVLQELGLSPDDIGTHSIRKGSATYCSSGSTACPSSSSIRLRAGWATGAVHELYCQYEQAGDQHVGRTACGLPIDKPEFASLPPHFDVNSDTVSQAIMAVYPALYRVAPAVASFCLASLLFHDSHLSATLPARHPLRQTHYFQNTELKNAISRLVVCSSSRHDSLKPTGVPPHVSLLVSMTEMATEIRELAAVIRTLPTAVSESIEARDSERDARSNAPVTRADLGLVIRQTLQDAGWLQIMERLSSSAPTTQVQTGTESTTARADPQTTQTTTILRAENGTLSRVPSGFTLPRTVLLTAWQLWYCGTPPLRWLQGPDLAETEGKRLGELRFVMTMLQSHVPSFCPRTTPTVEQANEAFFQACDNFELLKFTPTGRPRRIDQLLWTSAATLLREQKKRRLDT